MVDTVLYFEGDRYAAYRILRGVKNRFGSTNEIGVFEMRDIGLVEVENPSEYMLSGKPKGASGSVVACSVEGSRPILLEIQALVCRSNLGIPRRTAAGTDINRVNLLMAVLEKRLGLSMSSCDAYINIAGGIRMNEPAVDLGIVLAMISSYKDCAIPEDVICFGEVGLSGEVRAVNMAKQRVAEKYNRQFRNPFDLEPEEEVLIGQYFKEEYGSDFVFVTHYPSKKRPFYAMDDPADETYTLSFDLLFRGLEITTGGQRIHDYNKLMEKIAKRGMETEGMESYLSAFKYGMPPHGGLGIGLERLTMQLIGEDNVRAVSYTHLTLPTKLEV